MEKKNVMMAVLVTVFAWATLVSAATTIVAQWPGEFAINSQGANNWYYLETSEGVYNNSETVNQIPWNSTQNAYYDYNYSTGMGTICGVWPDQILPGEYGTKLTVLRWVSEVNSDIQITGSFQKPCSESSYDGIVAMILVNGETKYSQAIGATDIDFYSFDFTVTDVQVGDDIDFVVNPNAHNWGDETKLAATISVVPEPVTLMFLCLGSILLRKRSKMRV
jgi:hypothetical protein